MSVKQKYNKTFDIMKGICILLMILCHLLNHNYRFIYSFHMPLFFILAGYFVKDITFSLKEFGVFTKKNAIRLLVPYFVTMFVLSAYGLWQAVAKENINLFLRPLLSTFWMGADEWHTSFGIISVNALWFIIALFWTRTLFYLILWSIQRIEHKNRDCVCVIICGVLTMLVSYLKIYTAIPPCPLSIMQGVNALLFYSIGWYVKRNELSPCLVVFSIICWPFAIYFGQIEMFGCYYKIFPLDVLGACGATWILYELCSCVAKLLEMKRKVWQLPIRFLDWAGINSLLILCVHEFDLRSGFIWSIKCRVPYINEMVFRGGELVAIHLFIAVVICFLLTKIPMVNKLFCR